MRQHAPDEQAIDDAETKFYARPILIAQAVANGRGIRTAEKDRRRRLCTAIGRRSVEVIGKIATEPRFIGKGEMTANIHPPAIVPIAMIDGFTHSETTECDAFENKCFGVFIKRDIKTAVEARAIEENGFLRQPL